MKKSALFEAVIKQGFQTTSHFNINSKISSPEDCINAFWYIEEQISIMANEIAKLMTSELMRNSYPINESYDQVLNDYKKVKLKIENAKERVDLVINNLKRYLEEQKEKTDKQLVTSLDAACDSVKEEVILVDNKIAQYRPGLVKIDISLNCLIFYKTIEKFNDVINDFNTYNQNVKNNEPRFSNYNVHFDNIENLKNYSPS